MHLPEPLPPPWQTRLDELAFLGVRLGFEDLQKYASQAGLLNFNCPVIIVAGTNGKGSCIRALEAIYVSAGYKTAVTSSPHLFEVTERIRLSGNPISANDFIRAAEKSWALSSDALTYFEFITLTSLFAIQDYNPDVVILEVGLGGRLDAMNVVNTDLSIITSIDYDHQQYLGNTLDDISAEKAGIIHGGQIACVLTEQSNRKPIIERAAEQNVPCILSKVGLVSSELNSISVGAALSAVEALKSNLPVQDDVIRHSLNKVTLLGRKTTLSVNDEGGQVLIDVAHNPAACADLAAYLEAQGKTIDAIVFTGYSDKDLINMVASFKSLKCPWYIPNGQSDKRLVSSSVFTSTLESEGISAAEVDSVEGVLQTIFDSNASAFVLIFGGFFVATEGIRAAISIKQRNVLCITN